MEFDKKEYFGFDAKTGGCFFFQGVMDNDKEIDRIIVDRNNSTATVKYTDGYQFSVSATITKNGDNFVVTNIQKSWSYSQNNQNNG